MCANGNRLPLFVIVARSGGRVPFEVEGGVTARRAECHSMCASTTMTRCSAARSLGVTTSCGICTLSLRRGTCRERSQRSGRCCWWAAARSTRLQLARRIQSGGPHVSFAPLPHPKGARKRPLLKKKVNACTELRETLPTVPRTSKFKGANLMQVIKVGACHGLSSINFMDSFKETGTWPICPAKVNIGRLLRRKG